MSGGTRQTFRGVTRTIFAAYMEAASKMGIHVTGPVGDVAKDGIRIQWIYGPPQSNSRQCH